MFQPQLPTFCPTVTPSHTNMSQPQTAMRPSLILLSQLLMDQRLTSSHQPQADTLLMLKNQLSPPPQLEPLFLTSLPPTHKALLKLKPQLFLKPFQEVQLHTQLLLIQLELANTPPRPKLLQAETSIPTLLRLVPTEQEPTSQRKLSLPQVE